MGFAVLLFGAASLNAAPHISLPPEDGQFEGYPGAHRRLMSLDAAPYLQ